MGRYYNVPDTADLLKMQTLGFVPIGSRLVRLLQDDQFVVG